MRGEEGGGVKGDGGGKVFDIGGSDDEGGRISKRACGLCDGERLKYRFEKCYATHHLFVEVSTLGNAIVLIDLRMYFTSSLTTTVVRPLLFKHCAVHFSQGKSLALMLMSCCCSRRSRSLS